MTKKKNPVCKFCTDPPHVVVFLRTAVEKLHGLSIKDTEQSMPISRTWAIEGLSSYKGPPSLDMFEKSRHSHDKCVPKIERYISLIQKHSQTIICY